MSIRNNISYKLKRFSRKMTLSSVLGKYTDVAGSAVFVASSTLDEIHGLENVRDNCSDTWWQSDGKSLPHNIDIIFPRPTMVSRVCVLTYPADESYSPREIYLQAGNDWNNMRLFSSSIVDVHSDWHIMELVSNGAISVMQLRLIIASNHHGGIESRLRQLLVCGPSEVESSITFEENAKNNFCTLESVNLNIR